MSDYVQRKVLELATGMAAVQEQDGDLFIAAKSFVGAIVEDCAREAEAADAAWANAQSTSAAARIRNLLSDGGTK